MRSAESGAPIEAIALVFEVNQGVATLTLTRLLGGTCVFSGTLDGDSYPLSGSGTFSCTNGDPAAGDWQISGLAKSDSRTMVASITLDDGIAAQGLTVTGIRLDDPTAYDPAFAFWQASSQLEVDFPGEYKGTLVSQNFACGSPVLSDTRGVRISIDGNAIRIDQDSIFGANFLFGANCVFDGTIDSFEAGAIQAAGTYACSDSASGSWATERLVMTGPDTYASKLNLSYPGCAFEVRYIGFRNP